MEWRDRWEWLSAALAGLSAWLLRRWLNQSGQRTVGRIADAMNAKAQLEICEAEREYLRRALREILAAAEEHEQWRKQQQPPSS
jgi:small-conductance mechanosensitive channel